MPFSTRKRSLPLPHQIRSSRRISSQYASGCTLRRAQSALVRRSAVYYRFAAGSTLWATAPTRLMRGRPMNARHARPLPIWRFEPPLIIDSWRGHQPPTLWAEQIRSTAHAVIATPAKPFATYFSIENLRHAVFIQVNSTAPGLNSALAHLSVHHLILNGETGGLRRHRLRCPVYDDPRLADLLHQYVWQ